MIQKYKKEAFSRQSKLRQNASIQYQVFEQAINLMGDTIEDMDFEIERKDKKIEVSDIKMGLPDSKIVEETNKLGLNKISSKRKYDRIIDRLNNALNNHKYIKNKNKKK